MTDQNGKVYVFNLWSETMELMPNSKSAGQIPGWGAAGGANPYQPAELGVNRVLNRSDAPGHFVNGKNNIGFTWQSGFFGFELTIDSGSFPISQNLLLFVSQNVWILYNQGGVMVSTGPVNSGLTHEQSLHGVGHHKKE
jgi:hypothetical protein